MSPYGSDTAALNSSPRDLLRHSSVALTDPAKDEAMTREEALASYHPIRASVRRILSAAISVCNQSDLMRAAKQLGLWPTGRYLCRKVIKPQRCSAT